VLTLVLTPVLSFYQVTHSDKTKETCAHIHIPHKRVFILVFCQSQWLVGDDPSTWNFGPNWPCWSVNADFQSIFACSVSAVSCYLTPATPVCLQHPQATSTVFIDAKREVWGRVCVWKQVHCRHCISITRVVRILGKTTESVHCTVTGPCLHMHHRPSACTLQHVTLPIRNFYRILCQKIENSTCVTCKFCAPF